MPALLGQARLQLDRLTSVARAMKTNFFWDPDSTQNIAADLQAWACERPGDPFLRFEGRSWSVGSFDAEVNRHARAWQALGIGRGCVVALLLENRPAFLFHFYALVKLGAVASLINPALTGPALRHALDSCGPAAILVGDAQLEGLEALREGGGGGDTASDASDASGFPVSDARVLIDVELQPGETIRGEHPRWASWNPLVAGRSPLPLAAVDELRLSALAAYVYTSGTTGLPKPAVVKHHRLRRAGDVFGGLAQMTGEDCLYLSLPLYHANASVIGVPGAIAHRSRLVLTRRFSARRFWSECRDEGASVCLYIGELCRYLHNQPPGPQDRDHQVRVFVGNGLREDIWADFRARFGVERIVEFYAATEGNAETANLLNFNGTVGPLLFWKMALVRWDEATGAVHRDARGRCERAGFGEPGLLIGRIDARNPYAGYTDERASSSKVLRDVFTRGDAWFNTGDLLRVDHLLHLHFVDRLGDTFRWKGENVSTQEVAEALNAAPGVRESNVYGVEIPGSEGRAGMAALVVDHGFSPAAFYAHVVEELPDYAQPRFLRLVERMGTTGTFKHEKMGLRDAGWDPAAIADELLIRDVEGRSYVALTPARREAVLSGGWKI
ncbi:long-chain-acyl-CoA synthetase [Pseudenhygromyxa sp. WMMC2535]|uniref:long-chain-acyl-CoA synthetase n=1 Tax=Pseudenhygromyxa sp. WMMC2535 TaxID=2712867 RepID=UPI001554FCD3|nr:long-chain-acyl-CoA synthetase [Pseudenhygromyxa sp. WMMC2535]NVB40483.1 long-chain-acyl-CoA synthetase [Pseudenhygromyxa sp. WMMC2535]